MSAFTTIPHIVRAGVHELRGVDPDGRRLAPGPKGDPFLGHFRNFFGDRASFLARAFAAHGDVVRMNFLGLRTQLFAHPDHVEHILVRRHRIYTKRTRGYRRMSEFLGNGLVTSDGDFWRRQRRIAQPAFHRHRIDGFADTMVEAGQALLERLDAPAASRAVVDVDKEMMAVTMRIAGETLLSADPSDRAADVWHSLDVLMHAANVRINRPFPIPLSIPTPQNRAFLAAGKSLDDLVQGIIGDRRRGTLRHDDLLQMLLEATDSETGEGMDDQQLRDEVMTLFVAGHETTSNMMTWTLYLLSQSPHHARRLADEAREVLGETRPPTLADLPDMPLTKRVLQESMRLYPPAWIVSRSPSEDDEIGGYRVPTRSVVFVSPYVTHRHPAFWDNPEGFDPDRWLPERVAEHHRCQYIPFAAGPRMCIGSGFAMMEGQLLLPMLVRRFHFDLVPGHPVEGEPLITLRPRYGMRMTVRPRA